MRVLMPLITALSVFATAAVSAMEGKGNSVEHFTVGTSLATMATTQVTTHPGEVFAFAKDDAAAFVASRGAIRGAQFERAAREYRSLAVYVPMSDDALAMAIVAAN